MSCDQRQGEKDMDVSFVEGREVFANFARSILSLWRTG